MVRQTTQSFDSTLGMQLTIYAKSTTDREGLECGPQPQPLYVRASQTYKGGSCGRIESLTRRWRGAGA